MSAAGVLLWVSIKPLFKMAITTSFGYFITKCDLFPSQAARGVGQVIVNITMPSLIFSKTVPSFNSSNINALGPLILIGTLYQVFGFLLALVVRQFFWVPHRFRYGILAAGTWGNWADIPTAVIMSITSAPPFTGQGDSDLAVAYVSVFILVFYTSLFPLGGHLLVAKDFKGPDFGDDEVRMGFMDKLGCTTREIVGGVRKVRVLPRVWLGRRAEEVSRVEKTPREDIETGTPQPPRRVSEKPDVVVTGLTPRSSSDFVANIDAGGNATPVSRTIRQVTFDPDVLDPTADDDMRILPTVGGSTTYAPTTAPDRTVVGDEGEGNDNTSTPSSSKRQPSPSSSGMNNPTVLRRTLRFLSHFATPPTISIVLSFPVALIPSLKALVITTLGTPHGPDGQAPLGFIMDTATFIGAASVPLGLICLGSALAKLSIPKPWTRLPLGAIGWFAIAKLFVMPVLGVALCQGLTYGVPLIGAEDKVLRYVCMFISSVPTATAQVYLTQVYSPDGTAQHLSAFLVPQYALLFISMTCLNAYALNTLFP